MALDSLMRPRRFRRLPSAEVMGGRFPVAKGPVARLLGLAMLRRERAGPGLLIPCCRSVHTFGMRFAIEITFLDADGRPLRRVRAVPRRRIVAFRSAHAVLERPVPERVYPQTSRVRESDTEQEDSMNLIDKLTGRAKKAAGDLADDATLRREGRKEERKGEAKEKRDEAADKAAEKSEEVADLERKT